METMTLIAQTGLTTALALWLFMGVRDNILHPKMNGEFVAEVLELRRMKEDYPDHHAMVAHRAIFDPGLQKATFRFVVIVETLVCLILWIGAVWLALSIMGVSEVETARIIALAGALGFTAIWSGFVIVGNHFAYWYCHEGAQVTHFHLALMGIGTMILLVAG